MKRLICILTAACIIFGTASCTKLSKAENDGAQQTQQTNENNTKEPETTKPETTEPDNTSDAEKYEEETTPKENDPAAQLRSDGEKIGAVASAAYIGFVEENTLDAIRSRVSECACGKENDFLKDIPEDRIIILGGYEIYCVVPTDSNAEVKVNKVEYSENGIKTICDTVYQGGAEPILIVCNLSDIMANNVVTVKSDGAEESFSLLLSLYDGTMAHDGDANINDFTVNADLQP